MTATPAAAAAQSSEALLFFTLLELAAIVIAGRIGSTLARRWGQAAAVGEIIAGLVLGPSLFGLIAPRSFDFVFRSAPPQPLQILSNLGLVLLMFQIGLEFDFSHLTERANRGAVLKIAVACLAAPFALGAAFGYWVAPILSPHSNATHSALFVATAFSITALPILGRIMVDFRMTRSRLGVIAISAAAINDVVGWLVLALITALVAAKLDAGQYGLRVGLVVLYALLCIFAVRPLLKRAVRQSAPSGGHMSGNLLGGLLAVIFLSAMVTYKLGIFAIFGGFMMGVILYDEAELVRAWRERVGDFVTVFFLPIFFTYTGLRTSIGAFDGLAGWGWCALTIALATAGKFGGAYFAARAAALTHTESMILGFMMNTRALMELVVVNVGFDLGVISQAMFNNLVLMAIVSTVITTPALRYYLPRAGVPVPERLPQRGAQRRA
jgi:Kef-type K+ transport system membrane component KefB